MMDEDDVERFLQEDCINKYLNQTEEIAERYPDGFCDHNFDFIFCWPPTPINHSATQKCYSPFFNFDQTQNATKHCLADGNWSKTDYLICETGFTTDVKIYFIGHFISLVTLFAAMAIFTFFKELQCQRNSIHKNLMWSYIFAYIAWIVILLLIQQPSNPTWICNVIITIYQYFHNATFFWMFVEGLYLYTLVIKTMTSRTLSSIHCAIIGWGLPLLFVFIWVVTKIAIEDSHMCSWIVDQPINWINYSTQLAVLIINLYFLLCIMWVLITKLRTANTAEIQQSFKAAKALLVLIPLLGITYIITIYAPMVSFDYARAVFLSTQGFAVALLYCFLHHDVHKAIKHRYVNWMTSRSLNSHRESTTSRNFWWPRTRSHSMRHTEWTLVNTEDLQTAPIQPTMSNGYDTTRVETSSVR